MKKITELFKKRKPQGVGRVLSNTELDQRVIQGAEKAVKDFGGVFKRLAEYDRT